MKRCFLIGCLVFLMFFAECALASKYDSQQSMNFGSVTKLSAVASVHMSPSGVITPTNVQAAGSGTVGILTLSKTATWGIFENNELRFTNLPVTMSNGSGGTATIPEGSCVANPGEIYFPGGNTSGTKLSTNIGCRVDMTADTKPGTYVGSLKINVKRANQITNYDVNNFMVYITVLPNLEVQEIQPLNFGKIIKPITASSLTLNPNGTYNAGSLSLLSVPQAGVVEVSGEKGMPITCSVTSSAQLTGPGTPISVTNINLDATSIVLDANSGTKRVKIGGTANINAKQARGMYTGSLTVTASY